MVCVFFPFILDIKFVGRTSRGLTGGTSHRISHPPSFCGACLMCDHITVLFSLILFLVLSWRVYMVKAAVNTVNTVWILSKSCMFFWVFRFAKNTNFPLFFSMRIFRVQFRFSQVPRLVEFLDRIYFVQTPAQSNAHAQLCYQGLSQPPRYL